MLRGAFRTKEGKIIAAIIGIIVMIIVILVITNDFGNQQFTEQAVMAENYLRAGNYKQAVEAYRKALSRKDSDQERLSIGLADAYVGMEDFDQALEVLRTCYKKTSGIMLKEKIEEVTSEKTDYEYLQSISCAEVYFSNKEYDKAIVEYEEAKLIKSKEADAYKRIAEAYIELGEYDLAKEEVLEGQEMSESEDLKDTLAKVDAYLLKAQYDEIVAQAEEYIYQENYEDGITAYKEAIALMPSEAVAYQGLGEIYLENKQYNKVVLLLEDAKNLVVSSELDNLMENATELLEKENTRKTILTELYSALAKQDIDKIIAVLGLEFFKKNIATDVPVYFGAREGDISSGYGMIIYDSTKVYFGDVNSNIEKGMGFYFMLTESDQEPSYYYYTGEWNDGLPNGVGKTVEVSTMLGEDNKADIHMTITKGVFDNAVEKDDMKKYFYINGKETGRIQYSSENGVPLPMPGLSDSVDLNTLKEAYTISEIYLGEVASGEYYFVEPGTIWGVKPFMKE